MIKQLLVVHLLFICVIATDMTEKPTDYSFTDYFEFNSTFEPSPVDITISCVYFILSIVGIAANLVVFFVIIAGKEIAKTVTAMYVLQLTIADSLFLSMLPLFAFYKLTNNWTYGIDLCRISRTLQTLNYTASVFFLTAMSVDRYIAVAYNTRSQLLRTMKRTSIVCGVIWTLSFCTSMPDLIYSGLGNRGGDVLCESSYPDEKDEEEISIFLPGYDMGDSNISENLYSVIPEIYINSSDSNIYMDGKYCQHYNIGNIEGTWKIIQFVLYFIIPFIIITISYFFIVRKLRLSENKVATSVGQRTARVRKRVTRMVAILVVCFVCCWFPHHVMQIVKIKGLQMDYKICDTLTQVFTALAYANSAINPLLYTFLGHNFRERFNESVRNTRKVLFPGILRRKIKMSSSLECKRPSLSGKYRKSATVKTDDRNAEQLALKDVHGKSGDSSPLCRIESENILKSNKKKNNVDSRPCDTEMTPLEEGRHFDEDLSSL